MNLLRSINIDHVKSIAYIDPDKLAPSLGLVIRSIVENVPYGEGEHYHRPRTFFALTYPTANFLKIVKSVVQTFVNGGAKGVFLNLDMGSGKTHLLTLLLHLFATCNLVPEHCTDAEVNDYKAVGYSIELAKRTTVFAFDLRTPKDVYRHHLKLTKMILNKMGLKEAEKLIEESIREERMPDPQKLADLIPDDVNVLILIDELYYGALSTDPEEREIVKSVTEFTIKLLDYRRARPRRSGIVVVVASARRDEELWNKLKVANAADQELDVALEKFIRQLDRILGVQETRWLSIEDAKRIIERRLLLPSMSFDKLYHRTFDKFVEKVIRVDTDVPQAHHMRSLIKAMAIFTLNAINAGDEIVTPAHFSEDIISVLLLGEENLASIYRSIYGEITSHIQKDEALRRAVNTDALKLAVNAIFALTITGDPRKLIDIVKAAKTKEYTHEKIPLVEETELRDILQAHKFGHEDVKVVDALTKLHTHIHFVKTSQGKYAFFVAPVTSIVTLYTKIIEDKYRGFLITRNPIVDTLVAALSNLRHVETNIEMSDIANVDKIVKERHSKDKLYVYILVDKSSLIQMANNTRSVDEVLRDMKGEVEKYLVSKGAFNIVFILPQINDTVLSNIARYLAIDEATRYVIDHYIAPIERKSLEEASELDKTLYELIRLEHEDLLAEVNRRLGEAVIMLSAGLRASLAKVVYCTPGGVFDEVLSIDLDSRAEKPIVRDLFRASDILQSSAQRTIMNLKDKIMSKIKELKHLVFVMPRSSMYSHVVEALSKEITTLLETHPVYKLVINDSWILRMDPDNRYLYIPPSTMREVAKAIESGLQQQYRDRLNIIEKEDAIIIELRPEPQRGKEEGRTDSALPGKEIEEVSKDSQGKTVSVDRFRDALLVELDKLDKGRSYHLTVVIKVNKDSIDTVKRYIGHLKRYIASWKIEAAG